MHRLTLTALMASAGMLGSTVTADDLPAPPASPDAPVAAPVADDPIDTPPPSLIDDDTVAVMAQRQLQAASLSSRSHPDTLWPALIDRTVDTIRVRHQLGTLNAQVARLNAELDELRTFVQDHDRYGDDFASYRRVIDETRRQTLLQARLDRERRKLEQDEQRRQKTAEDQSTSAERAGVKAAAKRLKDLGFSPVGQDVWLSRSAYAYAVKDLPNETVYYRPSYNGSLQRTVKNDTEQKIDYSKMTISGSLLNSAEVTRNIGVAFVFRDAHGNQIGQETVVIENARPGVPYPFTGELSMASQDQPFATTTNWVLFADAVVPAVAPTGP